MVVGLESRFIFRTPPQEDAAAAKLREQRLKEYAEKKSKKPGPIAKSSVLLDCKPWDDETDMGVMEKEIRKIEMDGLVWGAGKWLKLIISGCYYYLIGLH